MNRISKLAFALFFIFSLSTTLAVAQRRNATSSARSLGSASSYTRARAVLEKGITALGGLAAIRAAEDVKLTGKGFSFARNQSIAVSAPYDRMTRDEMFFIDLKNRRYIIETRDPLPGGFVFGGRNVINGNQGFFANPRDKTITPINLANFNNIGLIRRLPHLLLLTAYENQAGTLRWLGEEMYDRRPHNVITFASNNGIQWTLFFDARTNLLTKYEQMVSDNVAGDAVQETIFPSYRRVGQIQVPTARISRRAGDLVEEVQYTDVRFNTRPTESEFAKPSGYDELPLPTPAPTRETKLADGVYLFESGANSLVIVFDTYVMVVEPYAGGRGSKQTITKIKELAPGKPIKYVVITHHHDDHSGGLRNYIAEGATVVTTPANQSYFERMASGTFTINADDQTTRPRRPVFEFPQNNRRTFTDGKQTVEVIQIESPHAREMLIVYLPKEKLVFQGDLVNLPLSGKYMPSTVNASTVQFVEAMDRLGLDVKKVAAVHGPTTDMDDLRDAVKKQRTSN